MFSDSISQGWILCILTSLTCILGCCLITVDLLYEVLFPRIAAKHPFKIQLNSSFLVLSLSLSAGSLIFTSMYKLLPELGNYFDKIDNGDHPVDYTTYLIGFYILGIVICGALNLILHFFTSESVVHCIHGEEDLLRDGSHSHSHSHSHSNSHSKPNSHSHSHSQSHSLAYSHSHSNFSVHSEEPVIPEESETQSNTNTAETLATERVITPTDLETADETTALLKRPEVPKRNSIIDVSLNKLKTVLHKNNTEEAVGNCHGYDSFEKCVMMNNLAHHPRLQYLQHYYYTHKHQTQKTDQDNVDSNTKVTSSDLHYCDLPSSENLLFFQQHSQPQATSDRLLIHSYGGNQSNSSASSDYRNESTSPDDSGYSDHHHEPNSGEDHSGYQQHHHHVTTPLSRLFSIGLQTVLAILLHKFPEGFIMYSTSEANPTLGLTIFLSLSIHNFIEGFTMCLPMYLALNSRVKLILISGLLGGLAQPLGACLGWLFLRSKELRSSNSLNFLFGNLMAMTAGFLTIIGFQMYASAMLFGGSQRFTLIWTCIGISLIGFSYVLICDKDL